MEVLLNISYLFSYVIAGIVNSIFRMDESCKNVQGGQNSRKPRTQDSWVGEENQRYGEHAFWHFMIMCLRLFTFTAALGWCSLPTHRDGQAPRDGQYRYQTCFSMHVHLLDPECGVET